MTDDLPDHTNYSLIKAVDESGNLVTVLADSSGRIVSVMKGDYAGSMKTLAVDEKGRIQAVLTDPEDVFGNPNYIGAGELAARLGSIKYYEKRGEVIFMDDFEDATLKWVTGGTGTGHSEARSNESARNGNYSLKLVTGNAFEDYAYCRHYTHQPVMKKIGFEYSFALGSGVWYLYNTIYVYDGTYKYYAVFLSDVRNGDLYVRDENGAWQLIASSIDLEEHDLLYHSWKQVIDLETVKYVRDLLDNVEYDVSGYSFEKSADTSLPHMRTEIFVYNYLSANSYVYIDDVIITQNEP